MTLANKRTAFKGDSDGTVEQAGLNLLKHNVAMQHVMNVMNAM